MPGGSFSDVMCSMQSGNGGSFPDILALLSKTINKKQDVLNSCTCAT